MGWEAKGSFPGRGKILIFPLLHYIQNISWVICRLIMNGYSGFFPLDQGAEIWTWPFTGIYYEWVELHVYSQNTPCCHAQGEFYLYDVLEITLFIACRGNPIFKKKISFLCLVLCQEPFLWKALLHLCVSCMCIAMYHHAQRNSDI